jgi:RND family efflux transporter MFP subunit
MYIQSNRSRTVVLSLLLLGAAAALRGAWASHPEPAEPPRRLAVSAAPVERQRVYERTQRFVGRVEFAQASALGFELGGRVLRVLVDEGDTVRAGSVLAELDTARLRARRAELVAERDEARALVALAALRDARARHLLDEDVIAPQRADDARLEAAAREAALARVEARIESVDVDLRRSVLRAPYAGEVAARNVDAGVVVEAGQPVVRVVQTSRPEVRVGVARDVAARIAAGDRVALRIDGVLREGRVIAVLPERRVETRTVPVRVAASDTGATLREGDLAELVWRGTVEADGFWLPRAALTEGVRGLWAAYVAVPAVGEDGAAHRLERRPVETLHETGERVFVRGALEAGENVVLAGVHRLVPGQLVQLSPASVSVALSARPETGR